jgi:hypothetical protein
LIEVKQNQPLLANPAASRRNFDTNAVSWQREIVSAISRDSYLSHT